MARASVAQPSGRATAGVSRAIGHKAATRHERTCEALDWTRMLGTIRQPLAPAHLAVRHNGRGRFSLIILVTQAVFSSRYFSFSAALLAHNYHLMLLLKVSPENMCFVLFTSRLRCSLPTLVLQRGSVQVRLAPPSSWRV